MTAERLLTTVRLMQLARKEWRKLGYLGMKRGALMI